MAFSPYVMNTSFNGIGLEYNSEKIRAGVFYGILRNAINDDPTDPFQRWDAGLGFRIGAEYNHHYNLMFGCDWGFADIYRTSLRDDYRDDPANDGATLPKVHNFNFSITFGYRF